MNFTTFFSEEESALNDFFESFKTYSDSFPEFEKLIIGVPLAIYSISFPDSRKLPKEYYR